jgi:hypothetical protein
MSNHAPISSSLVVLSLLGSCTPAAVATDPEPTLPDEAPPALLDEAPPVPPPTPLAEAAAIASAPPPALDCAEWNAHTEAPVAFARHDGWVAADGSAVLVGEGSTFVHHTADRWSTHPGPNAWWAGVWGSASDDVFAVGSGGAIAHFDGAEWSSQPSGVTTDLTDVWGAASDDVFAVGRSGVILHYDGTAWAPMASGTKGELWSVWGSAPNEVLVGGPPGRILHYDGTRWQRRRFPSTQGISSLSGLSATDVYAITDRHVHHFDGSRWSRVKTAPPDESFWGVAAIAPDDVYALLGLGFGDGEPGSFDFLHFDGARWQPLEITEELLRSIGGSSSDHAYSFSDDGSIYRLDRSGVRAVLSAEPRSWHERHVIGSEHVAVSRAGKVWRRREGQWQELPAAPGHLWRDAWIDADDRVVAVGAMEGRGSARAVVGVLEGERWTTPWQGAPRSSATLHALRPLGQGEYLAVGNHGLIVRGGPAGWTEERSDTRAELTSLWIGDPTDVYVVGSLADRRHGGVILHHDGEGWTRVPTRVDPVRALWGTERGEIYAVGGFSVGFWDEDEDSRSVIMRFDGQTWSEAFVQPHEDGKIFERVAGNSSRDVFALRALHYGDGGYDYSTWRLYHYDGHAWRPHAEGGGPVDALVVTPDEVLLSASPGQHRWACKRAGDSRGLGEK